MLPLAPNTTCDIYRVGNAPPNPPDVAGVPCYLTPAGYDRFLETGEGEAADLRYTHVLLVALETDVRDDVAHMVGTGAYDSVWVPSQAGTQFFVVFVERVGRGTALDHRRVYLSRKLPTWPSNEL